MLDDVEPIKIHHSGMNVQQLLDIVDEVHADFFLDSNKEQSHMFCITAEHFIFSSMEQMLLFITGVGGTGESHVIKVIVLLFKCCRCPENLLLSTPMGSTVILIKGYTIHTLTFLPNEKEQTNKHSELQSIWSNIHYLVLDKISMVSAELLCQISKWIAIRKQADPTSTDKSFRGVNVIFAGDLEQLCPVGSASLFSTDLMGHVKPHLKEMQKGQDVLFSTSL